MMLMNIFYTHKKLKLKRILAIMKKDFKKNLLTIFFGIIWTSISFSFPFSLIIGSAIKSGENVNFTFILKNMFTLYSLFLIYILGNVFYNILVLNERKEETFLVLMATPCSLIEIWFAKIFSVWLCSLLGCFSSVFLFLYLISFLFNIIYIPSFGEIFGFFSILIFLFSYLSFLFLIELLTKKLRDILSFLRIFFGIIFGFLIVFLKFNTSGREIIFSIEMLFLTFAITFFIYLKVKYTDKEKLFLNVLTE